MIHPNAAKRHTPAATPTPIPALAPVDKPEDGVVEFEVVPDVIVGLEFFGVEGYDDAAALVVAVGV
jgi:hypothetical protein